MKFLENVFWSSADPAELPTLTGKAAFNKFNLEPIDETEETSDTLPDFSKEGPYFKDLDSGATELYNHIQLKRWSRALTTLEQSPEQAKVWIFRLEDDGLKLRWRVLPLHAALILKAPDNIIEALLRANRFAANAKDDQGSLPLHIGCKVGMSKNVTEMLLTVYPRAVIEKDGMNRLASSLLDMFNPPQKAEITEVINEQLAEYKNAFESLDQVEQREQPEERDDEDDVAPLRNMAPKAQPQMGGRVRSAPVSVSIDMKKPVMSLVNTVVEDKSNVDHTDTDCEPEQLLSELQQKHKERLIAMKEATDIQDEASIVGEEMTVKSKLSQVQVSHMNELQKLKEELGKARQRNREEEKKKLDLQIMETEKKYDNMLREVEFAKEEAEKKGSHLAALTKLNESIRNLKKKREEQLATIKKTAEIEHQIARQEEGRRFEEKVKSFEETRKKAVIAIQNESKLQREQSRAMELAEFEERIQQLEKEHQKELQQTAMKLEKQRNTMENNQRELFDRRLDEMQRQHAEEMKEFQAQLVAAQEANRNERARIVDTKIEELQQIHLSEIDKIEKKAMETICELEDTISALKEDLAKAKSSNLDNTTMVQKSIQSMQKHVDDTTTKATSQVKILEATVTTLESSLEKSRKQSVQLEEHVKVLEENLRLRAERDKEIEERLNRIQRTCLCFEFSS